MRIYIYMLYIYISIYITCRLDKQYIYLNKSYIGTSYIHRCKYINNRSCKFICKYISYCQE